MDTVRIVRAWAWAETGTGLCVETGNRAIQIARAGVYAGAGRPQNFSQRVSWIVMQTEGGTDGPVEKVVRGWRGAVAGRAGALRDRRGWRRAIAAEGANRCETGHLSR